MICIDAGAFAGACLSFVVIPGRPMIIAGGTVPGHCTVTLSRAESDAELNEKNPGLWPGSGDEFK
jgi:hypothetical protein